MKATYCGMQLEGEPREIVTFMRLYAQLKQTTPKQPKQAPWETWQCPPIWPQTTLEQYIAKYINGYDDTDIRD